MSSNHEQQGALNGSAVDATPAPVGTTVPSGPAAADPTSVRSGRSDGQPQQSAQQQQQEQCHAVVMHDNEDVCISPAPGASSPLLHSSPGQAPGPTAGAASSSSSSLRCRAPIQVDFRNLTAVLEEKDWLGRSRGREHTIVQRISGRFAPGKLVGILGGSGSGQAGGLPSHRAQLAKGISYYCFVCTRKPHDCFVCLLCFLLLLPRSLQARQHC
jgi:hypothetical protein